jgi:hypothetical protein
VNEQTHTGAALRVHRTAPKITKRIREVLNEPDFPVERTYQWAAAGKFRHFYIGPNICARDDFLVEDLTGGRETA